MMKKTLLILMTLFAVGIGYSQTFTDNFITYQITSTTNNTVKISDYNVAGGTAVDIPATVTDASTNITYIVTEIGILAFNQNNLTSVIIPNSITSIGTLAFVNNFNLSGVILPNGITTIGNNAFESCGLTSINIPTSMTNIGESVFFNNDLISVTIPNNITSIGDYAFTSNNLTSIVIPNSVSSIGIAAFSYNDLTSVTLPNSIIIIENQTFEGNNLSSITIPDSVTSIGDSVFWYNPLTCVISESTTPPAISTGANDTFHISGDRSNIDLSIPSSTASAYAAAGWTGFNSIAEGLTGDFVVDNITYQILPTANNEVTITSYNTAGGTVVNIPATVTSGCTDFSVTEIGSVAFNGKGLTSVTIPNSVITIHIGAFLQNSLTSIVIPDSVTFIGNLSFKSNQITSVVIPSSAIAGYESFKDNALINVTFEDGVTGIGSNAFENNQISNITLPSSVTVIGSLAFAGNPLTSVTSLATTPPSITTGTDDTFGSIANRGNIHLHIPVGTMGAYVTDGGALWTGFNPVTEDAALSVTDFELANTVIVITTPNELNVISSGEARLENYTIYSITGAKVNEGTENTIAIDVLSKGIYILELTFDSGKLTKKFVK